MIILTQLLVAWAVLYIYFIIKGTTLMYVGGGAWPVPSAKILFRESTIWTFLYFCVFLIKGVSGHFIKKISQCGIQDYPVLLTFSFKAYKHVLILKKGFQSVQSVQRVQSVQSVQRVQSVQSLQKRAVAQQRFPKCPNSSPANHHNVPSPCTWTASMWQGQLLGPYPSPFQQKFLPEDP